MQPHIQIAVSEQEVVQLRPNRPLGLVAISFSFRKVVFSINNSSDLLECARLCLPSLVNFHIAHASKVLRIPVTIVKTPIMRLMSVSVDNLELRGKKAAKM
jgi:hypothetical protein